LLSPMSHAAANACRPVPACICESSRHRRPVRLLDKVKYATKELKEIEKR
jgi:hypothetical protein